MVPWKKILYLDDIQEARVYVQNEEGESRFVGETGILVPISSRNIYKGLVIPGYGYSAQVAVSIPPGKSSIRLEVSNMIPKFTMPGIRL